MTVFDVFSRQGHRVTVSAVSTRVGSTNIPHMTSLGHLHQASIVRVTISPRSIAGTSLCDVSARSGRELQQVGTTGAAAAAIAAAAAAAGATDMSLALLCVRGCCMRCHSCTPCHHLRPSCMASHTCRQRVESVAGIGRAAAAASSGGSIPERNSSSRGGSGCGALCLPVPLVLLRYQFGSRSVIDLLAAGTLLSCHAHHHAVQSASSCPGQALPPQNCSCGQQRGCCCRRCHQRRRSRHSSCRRS